MKTFRSILLGVAFFAAVAVGSAASKQGWLTDLKAAQADAKAQNKILLVDFTGSDWCGWCIKLDKEVFSKPEFKEYADKNLILLEVDFPRSTNFAEAERRQNEKLAQVHGIQGFPTVVVLDSEGRRLGTLGYTAGGPAAFIAELERLRKGSARAFFFARLRFSSLARFRASAAAHRTIRFA